MIIIFLSLVLAAVLFDQALRTNKHLGFWVAGVLAIIGISYLLDFVSYRTTFAMEIIEQRAFPGIVRRLRYVDIEKAELRYVDLGSVLYLFSIDGKRTTVYGDEKDLRKARELLSKKFREMGRA